MIKPGLFCVSALLAMVLIVGCGPYSQTDEPLSPTGKQPIEITVQIATSDKPVEVASLQKRIARFQQKFPDVLVKTDSWQYSPDLVGIRLATNQIATEYNTYASEGWVLLERRWMSDMTDLLSRWPHRGDLNPKLMKPFTVNGLYNAVPEQGYLMTVTLNKRLFEQKGVPLPPLDWTWDDLLDAAVKVNDPSRGIAGFVPMTKGNEAGWNWVSFLYAAGGDVAVKSDAGVKAAFNSEAGLKALEFYQKLKNAKVLPTNWVLGYQDAFNLFSLGRGAMIMAGSGDVVDYAVNQGRLKAEDLVVYPMPAVVRGGKHLGVFGGNYHVISPYATKEQREWAFKFLTDEFFTDEGLAAIEQEIQDRKQLGQTYVPRLMNYWKPGSEYDGKVKSILKQHDNVYQFDPELLKLLDGKEEPPYEAQTCYAEMANMIQDVLTSKTADLPGRLDLAAEKLQHNVFDKLGAAGGTP